MEKELEKEPLLDAVMESSEGIAESLLEPDSTPVPPSKDATQDEAEIAPEQENGSQLDNAGTSQDIDIVTPHAALPPPSPDRPPSMLDYDVINGVPVRIIKADRFFQCHAFSEDGQLFATGDRDRIIKYPDRLANERATVFRVWRRTDYTLVGMLKGIYTAAMAFVGGENNILRILDCNSMTYVVVDLKIRQSEKKSSTATKCLDDNLKVIKKRPAIYCTSDFRNANFSKDGKVLSVAFSREIIRIPLLREDAIVQRRPLVLEQVMADVSSNKSIEYAFATLSPNGEYTWVLCTDNIRNLWDRREAFIAIYKAPLHGDTGVQPVIIKGNRAVWMASGEYLAVWDEEDGRPRISVYKTEDLARDNITPINRKNLRLGLANWQALETKQSDRLLLREISNFGQERYAEWNFKEDIVINEVFMNRQTEVARHDYQDMNKNCERDLCSSCDKDGRDWIGSVSLGGLFAIASYHSGSTVLAMNLPKERIPIRGKSVKFDYRQRHLLIIGGEDIYAVAPISFQRHGSCQCSTIRFPKEAVRDDRNGVAHETFHQLGSRALAAACSTESWRSYGDDPLLSDVERIALTPSGGCCVWVRNTGGAFHPKVYKVGVINHRSPNDGSTSMVNSLTDVHYADHPQAVFLSPVDDDKDRIVIMDVYNAEELHTVEVDKQGTVGKKTKKDSRMKECLHVYQTQDRERLVMLESKAVTIFDLKNMEVQERIPYKTDFMEVAKHFPNVDSGNTTQCHDSWAEKLDCRLVSDDGQTVLLGWDAIAQRSILVTLKTTENECEAAISSAGPHFSRFCQLTADGAGTLFTDITELSRGRIVIGVYSNRDHKVRSKICVDEDVPPLTSLSSDIFHKNFLFYGMSDDASEILVYSVPIYNMKRFSINFKNELKRYSIYGTEECLPDYNRLIHSFSGTISEKVQRLFYRFGPDSVLNNPVSEGNSIFQEALQKGDQAMVKEMLEMTQREGFELGTQCCIKERLAESIASGNVGLVEEAITWITFGGLCPINNQVSVTTENLGRALKIAFYRVIKALQNDEFVTEACQIKVHTDFLDPVIRRDKAVHIGTLDSVSNWRLDDDPKILAQIWTENHSEIVNEMEKDGNQSKATASLKVVCINGAARPGPDGLVRHLLLHSVPDDVFKSKAVKWIVTWKWFKIWRPKFIQRGLLHVGYLCCLTSYAILLGSTSELVHADISVKVWTTILIVVLAAHGAFRTMEEKRQVTTLVNEGGDTDKDRWKGVRYYFSSKWNWVDAASCLMLLVLMPLFHILSLFLTECNPALSAVVAVEVLFGYIKVWYYVQPFRVTGALVLMIENIIRDCLPFLGLALIMLLGFVLAIQVLLRSIAHKNTNDRARQSSTDEIMMAAYHNDLNSTPPTSSDGKTTNSEFVIDQVADAFGTFPRSCLSLFYALFGEFDADVYSVEHELKWLVIVTFVMYMIAQVLVLLNLLISIMSDTFERVKSNEEGQMLMARAMIIDSCEASATEEEMKEMKNLTGKYVCALERVQEQSAETPTGWWTGKFNMMVEKLRATVTTIKQDMEAIVTKKVNALSGDMKNSAHEAKELRDEIKTMVNETKEESKASIQQQEQRIAAMERQLQQLASEQATTSSDLASAIADAKLQTEHRIQDLSTKIDRMLSFLETQAGT